jgi:hypothetical protein
VGLPLDESKFAPNWKNPAPLSLRKMLSKKVAAVLEGPVEFDALLSDGELDVIGEPPLLLPPPQAESATAVATARIAVQA